MFNVGSFVTTIRHLWHHILQWRFIVYNKDEHSMKKIKVSSMYNLIIPVYSDIIMRLKFLVSYINITIL